MAETTVNNPRFLALYCLYDPDNYMGHRKKLLKATTMDEADLEVKELILGRMVRGPWEYHIYEIGRDSGAKLLEGK
jgi:hypothetical protein